MNHINFLPESFQQRHAQRRTGMYRTAVIGVAVVIAVSGWVGLRAHTQRLRRQSRALAAQMKAAHQHKRQISALRRTQQAMLKQVKLSRQMHQPVTQTQILAMIGQLLPPSVTLVDLKMTVIRPTPMTKKQAKRSHGSSSHRRDRGKLIKIDMTGLAPNDLTVANTVGRLSDHPLFTRVTMRQTRTAERKFEAMSSGPGGGAGGEDRQFELMMQVDLNRRFESPKPVLAP